MGARGESNQCSRFKVLFEIWYDTNKIIWFIKICFFSFKYIMHPHTISLINVIPNTDSNSLQHITWSLKPPAWRPSPGMWSSYCIAIIKALVLPGHVIPAPASSILFSLLICFIDLCFSFNSSEPKFSLTSRWFFGWSSIIVNVVVVVLMMKRRCASQTKQCYYHGFTKIYRHLKYPQSSQ